MLTRLRTAIRRELKALRSAWRHYRRERTGKPMTMAQHALLQMDIQRQHHEAHQRLRHDTAEAQVRRLYEASRFVTKDQVK